MADKTSQNWGQNNFIELELACKFLKATASRYLDSERS